MMGEVIRLIITAAVVVGTGYVIGHLGLKTMHHLKIQPAVQKLVWLVAVAVLGIITTFAIAGDVGLFGVFSVRETYIIVWGLGFGGVIAVENKGDNTKK